MCGLTAHRGFESRSLRQIDAVGVAVDEKTIELRGGHANGRRVNVRAGSSELTLVANSADKFSAWTIYRPTSERCADGIEIWDEYLEPTWGDSGLVPL
jgi:hypothetical protein